MGSCVQAMWLADTHRVDRPAHQTRGSFVAQSVHQMTHSHFVAAAALILPAENEPAMPSRLTQTGAGCLQSPGLQLDIIPDHEPQPSASNGAPCSLHPASRNRGPTCRT